MLPDLLIFGYQKKRLQSTKRKERGRKRNEGIILQDFSSKTLEKRSLEFDTTGFDAERLLAVYKGFFYQGWLKKDARFVEARKISKWFSDEGKKVFSWMCVCYGKG